METLRVVLSIADFPPFVDGGVAEAAQGTFDALLRAGMDVHLVAARPLGEASPKVDRVHFVTTPFHGNPGLKYAAFNVASELRKRHEVRTADIFHSLSSVLGDLGLWRRGKAAHVVSIYNTLRAVHEQVGSFQMNDRTLRSGYYATMYRLERRLARRADAVVVTSRATLEDVHRNYGLPLDRLHLVHLGVDPRKVHTREAPHTLRATAYLLSVTRLVPRKGIEDLLDAFSIVLESNPGLQLLIVGRGDAAYERALRDQIKALGLANAVSLLGHVPNEQLATLYKNALLFVTCSRVEGFGLAPAEALASGVPVVAMDIPGIRDVVAPGQGSCLVTPRTPANFARAVNDLLHDDVRRLRLSQEARASASKFTWTETAVQLRQVYRRALEARQ